MFVYYGYALPLSTRIARGFYQDGIWSDTGFMRWAQISAVSWKEEDAVTLGAHLALQEHRPPARSPGTLYGRRAGCCGTRSRPTRSTSAGTGLDLGSRDEADAV